MNIFSLNYSYKLDKNRQICQDKPMSISQIIEDFDAFANACDDFRAILQTVQDTFTAYGETALQPALDALQAAMEALHNWGGIGGVPTFFFGGDWWEEYNEQMLKDLQPFVDELRKRYANLARQLAGATKAYHDAYTPYQNFFHRREMVPGLPTICGTQYAPIYRLPYWPDDFDQYQVLGPITMAYAFAGGGYSFYTPSVWQYIQPAVKFNFHNLYCVYENDDGEEPSSLEGYELYGDGPLHCTQGTSLLSIYDATVTLTAEDAPLLSETDWNAEPWKPSEFPSTDLEENIRNRATGSEYWDFSKEVVGRITSGIYENHWEYHIQYFTVFRFPGYPNWWDNDNPFALLFSRDPCPDPEEPGTIQPPKPIPVPWPTLIYDPTMRDKLTKALRIGLDLRPYEVMCAQEKIFMDGEQLTVGDE
jgi:hypothetical protein